MKKIAILIFLTGSLSVQVQAKLSCPNADAYWAEKSACESQSGNEVIDSNCTIGKKLSGQICCGECMGSYMQQAEMD